MVELDIKKFDDLRDACKKIKSGLTELQLCLDNLSKELLILPEEKIYIKRVFTLEDMVEFGNSKYQAFTTKARDKKTVYIRHSLIYLVRQHGFTYESIGLSIGLGHATCINACNKVDDMLYTKFIDFRKVFNVIVEEFNKYLEEKGNECLDSVIA